MKRGGTSVDFDGLANDPEVRRIREAVAEAPQTPFAIRKIGHVVLKVSDLERSVAFYTGLLGLKVSDVYPQSMMPGGMVFLRFNTDHHGLALIGTGQAPGASGAEMDHFAFEVGTLDEVFRAREFLRAHEIEIDFEGRRRAGSQIAIEFRDPDGHHLEIYWGLDQIGSDGRARPAEEWRPVRSLEDAIDDAPPGQRTARA